MNQNDFMGLLGKVKELRTSMGNLDQSLTNIQKDYKSESFHFSINGHGEITSLTHPHSEAINEIFTELKVKLNNAYKTIEEEKKQALLDIVKR